MKVLIFDIETGANSQALSFVKPFDKDNPDHVKYGNAKKEELREEIVKQAYAIYHSQAKEKFPLSAITGKILAISYALTSEEVQPAIWVETLQEGVEEADLLRNFWALVKSVLDDGGILVSFNGKKFDIPFVVQRSWILGTDTYPLMEGRWFKSSIVDLYEVWTFGLPSSVYKYVSNNLKTVLEVLGLGTKTADGKKFEKMFYEDPQKALDYCMNDITGTLKLYNKVKDFIKIKPKYNDKPDEEPDENAIPES